MRAKILLIIAICLIGLTLVVGVASWNLRAIASSVQQVQETSVAVYRLSIDANKQLASATAAVGTLFQAKATADLQLINVEIKGILAELRATVGHLGDKRFAQVMSQPVAVPSDIAGASDVAGASEKNPAPSAPAPTSIGDLVAAIAGRLTELDAAAQDVDSLALVQLSLVAKLATVKDDLSKVSRACLNLEAVDAKAFNNLLRGVITVLSTASGRDVKFAGKAKFEDGLAVLEKAELSAAQRKALAALKDQFEVTYEVVRQYLASGADSAFFLSKAKAQAEDLSRLEHSMDRIFTASQSALVARSRSTITTTLAMAAIIGAISLVAGLLVARSITGRMTRTMLAVSAVAKALGNGDLTRRVPGASKDELGTMAGAMNQTLDLMSKAMQHIGEATGHLTTTSGQLGAVSRSLNGSATSASSRAEGAATAARSVSGNVENVSASIKEMSASINEVASNTSQAAVTCGEAVVKAADARTAIAKLAISSQEIGTIVDVISRVASRTNLLALNATIEAARAGEAGRGFAVVANEVKALAQQTTVATEDIRRRIDAIRADSAATTEAMGHIDGTIQQVNALQQSIASAVEEQAATSREIVQRLIDTAANSSEVVDEATQVASATTATVTSAAQASDLSQRVAVHADGLAVIVKRFTY